MASFKCIACKGAHTTIPEMKACHTANGALIGGTDNNNKKETTKVKAKPAPVVSKTVLTFDTKEAAEETAEIVGGRLLDTVKVKKINVFNENTEKYETIITKTYTVVLD